MKYTNLDEWKKAVTDKRYVLKQVQGYEHFEALDGDRVVGRWNAEYGYLGEVEPTGVGFTSVRYGDDGPVVTEITDVTP